MARKKLAWWEEELLDEYEAWERADTKKKQSAMFDDDDDYGYSYPQYSTPSTYGYGSYGYGYTWKPKYDMGSDLEGRVTSLIRMTTGKTLLLKQTNGWGCDDKFFFYNPEDLRSATDDEVLGMILHQLARILYIEPDKLRIAMEKENNFRHLIDALEDCRADRQLHDKYRGCRYYADAAWDAQRDNRFVKPKNDREEGALMKALKVISLQLQNDEIKFAEAIRSAQDAKDFWLQNPTQQAVTEEEWDEDDEYDIPRPQSNNSAMEYKVIPAVQFNSAIYAQQNNDSESPIKVPELQAKYDLAAPHIELYLNSATIDEAWEHFGEIKKHYPIPDEDQQEHMDNNGYAGAAQLSQGQIADAARGAKNEEQRANGEDMAQAYDDMIAKGGEPGEYIHKPNYDKWMKMRAQVMPYIESMFRTLDSILQDNQLKRWVRPMKRGKIDKKSMYKLLATDSTRVFKRQRELKEKKYRMVIAVDQSGSMNDNQNEPKDNAFAATVILSEVFEKLGFEYEIVGFDCSMRVYKKLNRKLYRDVGAAVHFADGGTDDLACLEMIKKHLEEAPHEANKTGVFFITDGCGAGPRQKSAIKAMEEDGRTKVFGVGIGHGIHKDYMDSSYTRSLVVNDVSRLPSALIDLVKGQFRRGE